MGTQKRKKKTWGEEERIRLERVSWSADTDQDDRQHVWKREAVWEEEHAQFFRDCPGRANI